MIYRSLNAIVKFPGFAGKESMVADLVVTLRSVDGRTPAIVISVAHLDDEERMLVLGVILEEVPW